MELKLKCIKDCQLEDMTIKQGENIRALIIDGEGGIRFQQPDKVYTLPYYISDIEDCFITDFDEEEYNRRFKDIKNVRIYVGDELVFESDDAVLSVDDDFI